MVPALKTTLPFGAVVDLERFVGRADLGEQAFRSAHVHQPVWSRVND